MTAFLIFNTQVIPLKKSPTRIGRSLDNDVVIQEPSISRHHAEIYNVQNQYTVKDLNSTGGTYINGVRVKEGGLKSGDSIIIASTAMVFVDNAPQLEDRAESSTGPLKTPGPDDEPTVQEVKPDWRPRD
jgi:pSer/pThr/pTyr-binding forkhead associated (FHA) protein